MTNLLLLDKILKEEKKSLKFKDPLNNFSEMDKCERLNLHLT